jgi:hypothetical protein
MPEILKKYIPTTLMMLGGLSFITQISFFEYLLSCSPTAPNYITGEVYQLNNHGYYFYVTTFQGYLQYYLDIAFIILAFGGAALREHWHVDLISEHLIKPTDSHFNKIIHTRTLLIVFVISIVFILLSYLRYK